MSDLPEDNQHAVKEVEQWTLNMNPLKRKIMGIASPQGITAIPENVYEYLYERERVKQTK